MYKAPVGNYPSNSHPPYTVQTERLIEICFEKGAEPPFGQVDIAQ